MFKIIRGMFAKDMAIDLGTANTIVYLEKQGIVLNEPSVVAIETHGNQKRIRDVGHGAKQMLGRTPGNIVAVRPMKDGVIADYRITEQMLNHFIRKVHGAKFYTPGPRIVICVPTSATPVDRRAIRESAIAAGATKVFLIDEPMAAAIGCELPVHEASGSMVLDIGGGTAEIGVISLGGLVYSRSVPVGGDKIDRAIIEYVRTTLGIAIGESTSERIKKQIAVAHASLYEEQNTEIRFSGQNVAEGVPKQFVLTSADVHKAIEPVMLEIVSAVRAGLENVPPELSADISNRGISLTGGGALIRGLDKLITEKTGVPVNIPDDPLTCVARGCGAALQYIENDRVVHMFS
ncbi:MAG: rod shape-determining protein [Proteobacteria bacterium]|nr:rod shape-determining protein [Pseudomonadota bacterium]MCH9758492.1 rod shape-determining protein [Pseudomonadota bacterium]